MPGIAGGPSWSGAGWDPETGMYYVTTLRLPFAVRLHPSAGSSDRYVGSARYLPGPQGLPLFKPPWGSLVAIDMSSGEHRWRSPVGSGRFQAIAHLTHLQGLGWPRRSFVLVTKSLLLVAQQGVQRNPHPAVSSPWRTVFDLVNHEPRVWALDKASGRLLAEIPLPSNASGSPMTYRAGGKQYVVFAVGGSNVPEELIALALP